MRLEINLCSTILLLLSPENANDLYGKTQQYHNRRQRNSPETVNQVVVKHIRVGVLAAGHQQHANGNYHKPCYYNQYILPSEKRL